jgi:hypothetical protein
MPNPMRYLQNELRNAMMKTRSKLKLFIGVNLFSDNKAAEAIPVFKEYVATDPN